MAQLGAKFLNRVNNAHMWRKCFLSRNKRIAFTDSKFISTSKNLVDISVNDKTGVSTVTLQRPPVNGLNLELIQEFLQAMQTLEKNKCRGMIITSGSPTVFCAGLDILEMYKPNPDRLKQFWTSLQDMWLTLYSTPYPTAAAINGHSPAGGCLLALSCEYRVMVGPKYTIGLNETQLGIVAPKWFQDSMRNVLSNRQTELALTNGIMFTTPEALSIGLIDAVATDKEDAVSQCVDFITRFSKIPPLARSLSKLGHREPAIRWLQENKEQDLQRFLTSVAHPAVQKGLEIYLESLKKKQ